MVDNGSRPSDRSQLYDGVDDNTTIIANPTNAGYAAGCNRGVEAAMQAGYIAILIMNNDAFADPGSIRPLLARLEAVPVSAQWVLLLCATAHGKYYTLRALSVFAPDMVAGCNMKLL